MQNARSNREMFGQSASFWTSTGDSSTALSDLAIDSKLRGHDVVKLKTGDVVSGGSIRNRAAVIQQKTGRPVQFELMADARKSLIAWLD